MLSIILRQEKGFFKRLDEIALLTNFFTSTGGLRMASDSVSRVTRDFLSTTPGELCVSRDDIVLVKSKVDRLWSVCRLLPNGPEGLVPSGNLIEMDPPPVAPGQVLFVAVSDFAAQQEGDLIMKKGSRK